MRFELFDRILEAGRIKGPQSEGASRSHHYGFEYVGAVDGLVGNAGGVAAVVGVLANHEAQSRVQEVVPRTENVECNSPRLEIGYDQNVVHPHHHRHASALRRRTSFVGFGQDFHAHCARDAYHSEHQTLQEGGPTKGLETK